jgi:L-ascorbate metabolism protein UlaG (beta-lactamase superfamily)
MAMIVRIIALLTIMTMTYPSFSQGNASPDKLTSSAGTIEMNFIGHASLMFNMNGFIIYMDPVSSMGNYNNMPKADLVLITHEHSDHLDVSLIKNLSKPETVVIGNEASLSRLTSAQAMKNGDRKNFNGIEVEAVPAYNIVNMRAPGQPFHPKGNGNGYIITFGDKRIYVAGDTENTPEMKALKNIDVAFLPMNLPYTMTPAMVADAAIAFKPKILYPYHFGDTNTDEIVDLLKNTNIEVRIKNLK